MALSPGIPTSFVPRQQQQAPKRPLSSGNNLFRIVAVGIAIVIIAIAIGVFAYSKLLSHTLAAKQAQLKEAQGSINEGTIQEFIDLRDRLSSGKDLLTNHIVLSQFLDVLEGLTLQNVRFDDLKLTVAGDRTAKLEMSGTAKNFNALAAQSNAFAGDKRIKRAIFSGINLKDNIVTFKLTADIDSKLVVEQGTIIHQQAPETAPATTAPAATLPPKTAPAATTTPTPAAAVPTGTTAPKAPVAATTTS